MRLLHTSDWHLGRTFHGGSLAREQAAMIDSLVEMACASEVDAVVIAGDLFDRAIPPLDAISLFEDAVARLRDTGAAVIAISGNHDSHRRVSVHDRLLAAAGVTIRGDVRRVAEPVIVTPAVGGPTVAVYPVPYLDPPAADTLLGDADSPVAGGTPARSRPSADAITRRALGLIRSDLRARPGVRSVVVAHAFVTGGHPSDSERDLSIGDVDYVALDAFDGLDYVALGHLHGPQAFAEGRVAYSGSPLPYSFSEERHHKSARLVVMDHDGSLTIEQLPIDVGMRLRSLRGRLDDLLRDPTLAEAEGALVRAVLTDDHLPHQAMVRLRRRFPRAVELRHEPDERLDLTEPVRTHHRREATPLELVSSFWTDQHGARPTDAESALIAEALTAQLGTGS
ncbi:MAG: exonuclease SbcCD subunit D [Acidimicrobiales bacterium]